MKKNLLPLVAIMALSLFSSCSSTEVLSLRTAKNIEDDMRLYALPNTLLRINVEVTKSVTKRGPYYQHAKNLLGLDGVVAQDQVSWYISNIEIETFSVPDTNFYYLAQLADERAEAEMRRLSDNGLVMDFDRMIYADQVATALFLERRENLTVAFTDVSVKTNNQRVVTPVERVVQRDTTFITITEYQQSFQEKSLADKAQEAAAFVVKIRNRRFKLNAGVANRTGEDVEAKFPDQASLAFMKEELDHLEQEYLALFLGKTMQERFTYSFDFAPRHDLDSQRSTLFYFSAANGLSMNSRDGFPVYLDIQKTSNQNVLARMYRRDLDRAKNALIYRIPGDAIVKVIDANEDIAIKRVPVAQYGTLISHPVGH